MAAAARPARYFPVHGRPLRMRARFEPFGADHGNGPADAQYFQLDAEGHRYRAARDARARSRCGGLASSRHAAAHAAILEWMRTTLSREHPQLVLPPALRPPADGAQDFAALDRLVSLLQEDVVVVRRLAPECDAVTQMHVCFPSRWRPERLLGTGFRHIHRPVPGFADGDSAARRMLDAMILRGPFVRFVWTLCADDALDQHPDEAGCPGDWDGSGRGWLRIERQTTVGFPTHESALFLIRTYLRSFSELDANERRTLAAAIRAMPADVARYKGIAGVERSILRSLARA